MQTPPTSEIPVVILAGGYGSRLEEHTQKIPKPLVLIGNDPIIVHIIRLWFRAGFREFIIVGGYKCDLLKEEMDELVLPNATIRTVNTGLDTGTGGRLLAISNIIENRRFGLSYGDGLTSYPLGALLDFHDTFGGVVSMLVTHPPPRFGEVEIGDFGLVTSFSEKPISDKWINAGFFICEPEIFDYFSSSSDMMESVALPDLAKRWNLYALTYEGWWHCMDTPKDLKELNRLWNSGEAPWK